jgi:hypothetical protein
VITGDGLAIRAHDLYRFYRAGDEGTLTLRGTSLTVEAGEVVVIAGPSGFVSAPSQRTGASLGPMTRSRAWFVVPVTLAALLVGGCSPGGTSSPGQAGGSAAASPSESSPLGDIPDSQVYVPYTSADGSFSVTVPEGWARSDLAGGVSFTDKLNTVAVQELTGRPEPTQDSVLGGELAAIAAHGSNVALGSVETLTLPAGNAIHGTYAADSAPEPVTGKVRRDDAELYVFWRNGTEVLLTLSGPHGADDVDPWRTVSTSFAWL